ncbi:hypothetical protein ACEN9J_39940 [Variovorax sp. Varisp41]|nr:hypothetical protein [Variovorax sp. CY25R-8]MCT8180737.1 hypothetical protein [Variovorax sp. CY25R-8]
MLLSPPSGMDRVQGLAARLGCSVAVHCEPYGRPKAAVMGGVSSLAMTLKAFGGRWDRTERVYVFASWSMLEAALAHCVAHGSDSPRVGSGAPATCHARPAMHLRLSVSEGSMKK